MSKCRVKYCRKEEHSKGLCIKHYQSQHSRYMTKKEKEVVKKPDGHRQAFMGMDYADEII